jgi:1,4-alpha-glucan branching enzyme
MSAKRKAGLVATRESQRVLLELTWPGAQAVFIAGSFNDWHPSASPMLRLSDGTWAKELVLAPGSYEYRFVVDGQWVGDPAAKDYVPNPYGGMNAVLTVAAPATAPARRQRLSSSAKTALSRMPG